MNMAKQIYYHRKTMERKEPTAISLQPNHYGLIIDEHGELVEIYLPKISNDATVPDNIVKVMEIFTKLKEKNSCG